MALDDRFALAAVTARALALVLEATTARLPLDPATVLGSRRTSYAVAALAAPAIRTVADVAAIGSTMVAAAAALRRAADPADAAPAFYDAAAGAALAVPTFASLARTRSAALGRLLAECLEAAWLGEAFVAEARSDFADQPAAIAARKRIALAMDGALDRLAAAGVGTGVLDLLGSVARTASDHIAVVTTDLKPVQRVTTATSMPSTALAWQLYDDPARAPELVARNRVATPLFMPTVFTALAKGA